MRLLCLVLEVFAFGFASLRTLKHLYPPLKEGERREANPKRGGDPRSLRVNTVHASTGCAEDDVTSAKRDADNAALALLRAWCVLGSLVLYEQYAEWLFAWLPMYSYAKTTALVMLTLPMGVGDAAAQLTFALAIAPTLRALGAFSELPGASAELGDGRGLLHVILDRLSAAGTALFVGDDGDTKDGHAVAGAAAAVGVVHHIRRRLGSLSPRSQSSPTEPPNAHGDAPTSSCAVAPPRRASRRFEPSPLALNRGWTEVGDDTGNAAAAMAEVTAAQSSSSAVAKSRTAPRGAVGSSRASRAARALAEQREKQRAAALTDGEDDEKGRATRRGRANRADTGYSAPAPDVPPPPAMRPEHVPEVGMRSKPPPPRRPGALSTATEGAVALTTAPSASPTRGTRGLHRWREKERHASPSAASTSTSTSTPPPRASLSAVSTRSGSSGVPVRRAPSPPLVLENQSALSRNLAGGSPASSRSSARPYTAPKKPSSSSEPREAWKR